MNTLNQVYSSRSVRRRYEVWFLRLNLADGGGAWWLRYLLMNPGRDGCVGNVLGKPVQVWATWFPLNERPQSFIQGFPLDGLQLSEKGRSPFHFAIADNAIDEESCRGRLRVDGHEIAWDLRYSSTFQVTLSSKGWIGFSRTPHSDAVFSGHIILDGRRFEGQPLGCGLQGHNCGYRHRNFWTWAHAYFPRPRAGPSTFEALVYEMPFGLVFRKSVLWHEGKQYVFRKLREIREDRKNLQWNFRGVSRDGSQLEVALDGRGPGIHRLPYLKTDCSGTFEVANNSLASAALSFTRTGKSAEKLETIGGAVLEMVG
ncbi:MAG: hypothetical protein LAO09_13950 [Acidobacteriia bacterium]|nr:hypothetical protein [Terriglobia bacterium]